VKVGSDVKEVGELMNLTGLQQVLVQSSGQKKVSSSMCSTLICGDASVCGG